jgi:CHAT domain-containing protein/tetratricopeptide (TPR) repeat protein
LLASWRLRNPRGATAAFFHRLSVGLSFGILLCLGCETDPPSSLTSSYQGAQSSFERGDLKNALRSVDESLRVVGHGDPDSFWRLQLLKSEILIWQGRNKDALAVLTVGDVLEPSNAVLLARKSVFLGFAETNLQQLELADRSFQAAERMSGTQSPEVMVDLLLGEGKLAALRHDPIKSELLFKRALLIATNNHQLFLSSQALGDLGVLQMRRAHYADATDLFNASLTAAQKVGAQGAALRLTVNLALAYRRMGDLDRASELFEESEKSSERLGMISDQTRAVLNIGVIQFVQHHFSNAERDYQRALQLARQEDNQQEAILCLNDLAGVAVEEGNLDLAEKYNKEAMLLEHSIGDHDTELYSLVNEADISFQKQDRHAAERLLRLVVHDRSADFVVRAWALSVQARMDAQLNELEAAEKHYAAATASLEEGRRSLGRDELELSYPARAKEVYNDYIDFLVEHDMPGEAFRVAELQRARTLTDGLGLSDSNSRTFNVAEAERAALRLGHPILSYWIGTKASYLWIVLPDHMQLFVLPGEDQIRPLVERYRAHLVGALGGNDLADADGSELYRILIGPVEHWIKPQSEVTIISDGPLCGLNFETLVVKAPTPHYWIEDVSITNASSAFLLAVGSHARALHPSAAPRNLLLIGNPESPPNYPPLSHAAEEISLISEHFSKDQETVLSGKEATPAAYFKAKPAHYGLIHFVAHGTASRISPLDSAVVLSQDGSSYNLYARDIAANRLHADLVTISACDSAGSRIYSSEGLVGLSWAFLRAGARRVIASLWEVNDASTPKLMDQLYSAIAAGEDPAVALRNAKLSLLHSQTVYSRPFYWAPFVLYEGT